MSELISQVITPEVQQAFSVLLVLCAVIYVLVAVWVARDAYNRGTVWWVWALISLIPVIGVIAYVLLRPSLLRIDRDEQELEIALKQRQLMKYGECASCGYPVEADYVICPSCHQRLKNLCPTCRKALDPAWTVCPYCATPAQPPERRRPAPESASAASAGSASAAAPRSRRSAGESSHAAR